MKRDARLLDRFLQRRGDRWQYVRRVPSRIAHLDERAPIIRTSLKTVDLAVARTMRDALESADHELWSAMLIEEPADGVLKRYAAARRRASAMGFTYKSAAELEATATWQQLAERLEAILDTRTPHVAESAVLGGETEPPVLLSQVLKVYVEEIAAPDLARKSEQQRRKWRVVPERAVRVFIDLVGDLPIGSITRVHAQTFYRHWLAKIAPAAKGHDATHTPSSGNRQLGELRKIYREYYAFMGESDRANPFAGLSFRERKKKKRAPFPTEWIKEKLLKASALAGLNREARAILLVAAETGARPSEICNLLPANIHLC